MIDIHCHILPGIDDGPSDMDESVRMCRVAEKDGIRTIVATPHHKPGAYETPSDKVYELIDSLQRSVDAEGVSIKIIPGAEVELTPEFHRNIRTVEHLTINKRSGYVLAELPHTGVPQGWDDYLISLRGDGIFPIITHPERNPYFMQNPARIIPFVKRGGLVQITGGSILGAFGDSSRETGVFFLKNGFVHFIASDAHSLSFRPPEILKAVTIAGHIIGKVAALALARENPQSVIDGRRFPANPDVRPEGFNARW